MTRILSVLALACAVGAVGCNHDQMRDTSNNGMSNGDMSSSDAGTNIARPNDKGAKGLAAMNDKQFVADVAPGGMYEVEAGKLADTHSNDSRVKSLAQQMVADHTKANNSLMVLAKQKGIRVPNALTPDQQQMVAKLKTLQGADFDKEYLAQQDQAHQDTIAKFQTEASSGTDADLRAFASNTLPTLQDHLRMVKGAESGMKNGM